MTGAAPPASPHFTPVSLSASFNARRADLSGPLRPPDGDAFFGDRVLRGIPFTFGPSDGLNVILLGAGPVRVELGDVRAAFLVFVHAVADRETVYRPGLAATELDGRALGTHVSEYVLSYADGSTASVPVLRRFGIQQQRFHWGSSAFAAVPALDDRAKRSTAEDIRAAGVTSSTFGDGETRHDSGRDRGLDGGLLWIYALPNPRHDAPIAALELVPVDEQSTVYAVSLTSLDDHPLRPGLRRAFRVAVPKGAKLDSLGELPDIAVDLGIALSARAVRRYHEERWLSDEALVLPERSADEVLVEVAAHPAAILHVGGSAYELATPSADLVEVARAERPVRLRILDKETGARVAARIHVHGEEGQYLPPRGHHRRVNQAWFEDLYAEVAVDDHEYAYVDGDCVVDLPFGDVYVEISRGYEIPPIRRKVRVDAATDELVFELDRVLRWREQGWVTADTHVHFLSPQTALLEGQAEGVNVVNLLASQWGEMYSNVGDFDGKTTIGAKEFGGSGEFLVRVGSENRMQVLGHISLLGYSGGLIHPLCTGGPSESALGDPVEVSMAEWARRCLDQSGLVVMPHAPDPQLERAADIVLGVVDAIEMMIFNPLTASEGISPYGLADWYRYLNLGYHVPLVAGSDKMAASSLLGGIRTYVQLGEREFTYENWMEAVRAGDTFVTFGPLIEFQVDGIRPGGRIDCRSRRTLTAAWRIESVALPVERVEVVAGGVVVADYAVGGKLRAEGSAEIPVEGSTWLALRVRGSYSGRSQDIAAHSSAVQVLVDGSPPFSEVEAAEVLDQIQGAIAYVDTIAPRPEARRLRELRATLEGAYNRLHQKMHQSGTYHAHPLHDPALPHEH